MLGKKLGMTQIYSEAGDMVPVTVVETGPCIVTAIRTVEKNGYNAVQLGFGRAKKLSKPVKGHLKEINARYLREVRVDKVDEFKVGQEIKVEIFNPGDVVTVQGTSIGKGFAGTVKRYHYSRGPMSHGSKNHRLVGSIGAGTTPGRVFKGKGMAGRMGAVTTTVKSVKVIKVDGAKNLLLLKGTVPGKKGNLIIINRTSAALPQKEAKAKAPEAGGKK